MEVAGLNLEKSTIYGLMGNIDITTNNRNYSIVTPYKFSGSVKEYLNNSKDANSLKMVMLDETYLNKDVSNLSDSELKSIILAKELIQNKDFLVLDYFEKGFNYNEKEYFKRLFKRLVNDYNKTIIIYTNDITFLWDIIDELIIINDNIIKITKKEILNNLDKFDNPEIIKMVDLIKAKGINIDYYKNPMDLLKTIYRIKEQE